MNTKAELLRLNTGTLHETSEDFTLPDYLPEIRRIVSCTGAVLPESRYVDRGEVVLSGLVLASVCYVGDDGTLCSFPMNSEYTAKLSLSGHDAEALSADGMTVRTALESIGARATGPRRMSLSARMRSGILSTEETELPFELSASDGTECNMSDELSLEKRTFSKEYTTISPLSASGSVSGELRERDGTDIISCEGVCSVSSASADSDVVTLRGDVYIKCLAGDGEGGYFTSNVKAPFEERLAVKEKNDGEGACYAMGKVRCASVKLHGGEEGVYTWEAEYDAEAILCRDRSATVTDDVYSTAYESELARASAPVVRCLAAANPRLSVNASKQVTGETGKEAVFSTAKASVDRTDCSADGKLTVNGSCTVTAVLADDDGVVSEEITVPYRYECDCKKPDGAVLPVMCDVCVISSEATLEGDKLSVSCELNFSILGLESTDVGYVSRVQLRRDAPAGIGKSTVKLYFPYENETAWDIGKRYHCEMNCIKKTDNENCVIISK